MFIKIRERFKEIASHTTGVILIYTFLWMILAGLIIFIFCKNEKTFMWVNDGVYQHYVSFEYLCNYLKDFIKNLHFSGFFDFTLGQGMDALTTLNAYDFTDPISIFCALVLPLSRVNRYALMIFIKLYLVGVSFLFYCHVTKREKGMLTVSGAIAYVFCGAILFMFARHPNYINWAYFFPFLLGGIELYFRKKKKLPLILFVFLNLITSYYTFYMNVILVAIYVLVHVIYRVAKEKQWPVLREELIKCVKLLGVCCIGVLLSACILFPSIYAYLNNNRIGELTGYTTSMLFYEDEYYKNIFENLFAPFRSEFNTSAVGFNVMVIIPLILAFTKRKQYTTMKALFLISLIMMGIPLAGRIMNGFGYVTNRWVYVLPFYASIIFVLLFDEIKMMSDKQKVCVFLAVIVYVTLCLLHTETNGSFLKYTALIMLCSVVIIVSIALRYKYAPFEPLLFTLVFLGAVFQVYFTFSENEGNYVDQYLDWALVEPSYEDYSSSAVAKMADSDNFYRTEMMETQKNVNWKNKINGTGFWWSMVPGDMMNYYSGLAVASVSNNCTAGGLDGRTGLLELSSVKYYTRPAEKNGLIPYGYKKIHSKDKSYQIYENEYALPIGYTYTNYISSSSYQKMNGIEKEQALLQGAVLEEDIEGITESVVQFDYKAIDYDVTKIKGITMGNNSIEPLVSVDEETDDEELQREVSFRVDIPDGCEVYVYISGAEVGDESDTLRITATRTMGACSISKSATLHNLHYNWPSMRDDVAFNLGSGYSGTNIINLSFDSGVSLSYDGIQILAVPMSTYTEYAQQLGEYVLEDVSVGEDKINGTITIPEERILQFSVPYSKGWKAYVDGEEVSILRSDIMYMAIPISAGEHYIELRYETPYLRIGIIVSIVTAVLLIAYEIISYRRNKHRSNRHGKNKNKGVRKNG